jgi:hypothetical protein
MNLESLAALFDKGEKVDSLLGLVVQEVFDIEGFKIDSLTILNLLLEGADEKRRFGKFLKLEFNRKTVEAYVTLKFERKNGVEYLPYEFSKKSKVGTIQKIRLALEYDSSEGKKNPRIRHLCNICKLLTTEFILVIVYGRLVVRAGLILCCSRFQIKWSFSGKVEVPE